MFDDEKLYSVKEIKDIYNKAQQIVFTTLENNFKKTMKRFNENDESVVTTYAMQNCICLNELYYQLFIHDKIKEVEKYCENKKQNTDIQI